MPRPQCRVHFPAAILACAFLNQSPAWGDTDPLRPARWSGELGIGFEYDSNVSVEEVDRSTNQGDYALTLNAALEVQKNLSASTEVGLTYDINQSLYDEFSQVDRQTHIVGANFALDSKVVDSDLSLYYINSRLDGDKFLELYRVSPAISGFLAKKWFVRGAYAYSDKSIHEREGRDANTNSGEIDLYYFRRGLRSYFNLGYRFKDENARAERYDYLSNSVKLRYIHRIQVFSSLTKLELAWRYEDRDYRSDTPSIAEKRDDQRNRWRIDYEVPVFSSSAIELFYGYADYESNYPPADYDQELAGVRFLYQW